MSNPEQRTLDQPAALDPHIQKDVERSFARVFALQTAPALESSAVFVALGIGWIGRGDLARIELLA